jgi:hypothetical protein
MNQARFVTARGKDTLKIYFLNGCSDAVWFLSGTGVNLSTPILPFPLPASPGNPITKYPEWSGP